jgi:hypothetical protein
MRHNRDILWKAVLEWVMDDLLRFLYPNADQVFDLEKSFVFLDKELAELEPEADKKAEVRFVDKLVKVWRKDGKEEWVLIHIEVQDQTKPADRALFGERMFRYFYRCFDRYRKPVAAIGIFCGPDGRLLPVCYNYDFMGTRLLYEYNTIRILDYADEELLNSPNPFAWVILIAKKALVRGKDLDNKILKGKLFIFRKLYENGLFERQKIKAILQFLERYIRFENPEEIDLITGKQNTMDIFEIAADMKVEERLGEVVANLLKVTDFSDDKIASIAKVSLDFVKEVKEGIHK